MRTVHRQLLDTIMPKRGRPFHVYYEMARPGRSKYLPHQGKREMARRRGEFAAARYEARLAA